MQAVRSNIDPTDKSVSNPIALEIRRCVCSGSFAPSRMITVFIPKSVKIEKSETKEIIVMYEPNSETGSNLAI